MDRLVADSVRIEQEVDATRFILPKRQLEKGRTAGIVLLLFGGFVTAFMVFWMSGPLSGAWEEDGGFRWFLLLFGLLGTPGLLIGLGMIGLGLVALFNLTHSEVVVGQETIASIERCGFIAWRRTRAQADIERFVITRPFKMRGKDGRSHEPLGDQAVTLRAEGPSTKPLLIAPGYSPDIVKALAAELTHLMEDAGTELVHEHRDIEVIEETGSPEEELEVFQPAGSDAEFSQRDDGFTIIVPPAGLWKGSRGLFFFALVWNGFIGVFAFIMIRGMLSGSGDAPPLAMVLFLVPFLAVGIGVLLAAINMGKRRALLAVVGDTLAFRRIGPFGTKERKLSVAEIRAVRVGPSGMSVNDVPVMELQVHPRQGKKMGLLSQRDNDELKWIAYCIRQALNVRAT